MQNHFLFRHRFLIFESKINRTGANCEGILVLLANWMGAYYQF